MCSVCVDKLKDLGLPKGLANRLGFGLDLQNAEADDELVRKFFGPNGAALAKAYMIRQGYVE